MIYRTKLSSLLGRAIAKIDHDERGNVRLIGTDGRVLALVPADALFDKDGNYFQDDLEARA